MKMAVAVCRERRRARRRPRLVLITIALLLATLTLNPAYADKPEDIPVALFLSPLCGKSRARLIELLPQLERIRRSGGDVSYHVTLLSGDEEDVRLATLLVCADEQQKFAPFFLYVSQSAMGKKPLALDLLLSSLEIDSKQFKHCVADSGKVAFALQQSDDLLLVGGLSGVPSVIVGRQAFSLTDADSIIDALREERDRSR